MDAVSGVLSQVSTVLAPILVDVYGKVVDLIALLAGFLSPVWAALIAFLAATPLGPLYLQIFGPMGQAEFVTTFVPLLYVTVLPTISVIFALCRICNVETSGKGIGQRVLRRTALGTQGAVRMAQSASKTRSAKNLQMAEQGRAPPKGKGAKGASNSRRY